MALRPFARQALHQDRTVLSLLFLMFFVSAPQELAVEDIPGQCTAFCKAGVAISMLQSLRKTLHLEASVDTDMRTIGVSRESDQGKIAGSAITSSRGAQHDVSGRVGERADGTIVGAVEVITTMDHAQKLRAHAFMLHQVMADLQSVEIQAPEGLDSLISDFLDEQSESQDTCRTRVTRTKRQIKELHEHTKELAEDMNASETMLSVTTVELVNTRNELVETEKVYTVQRQKCIDTKEDDRKTYEILKQELLELYQIAHPAVTMDMKHIHKRLYREEKTISSSSSTHVNYSYSSDTHTVQPNHTNYTTYKQLDDRFTFDASNFINASNGSYSWNSASSSSSVSEESTMATYTSPPSSSNYSSQTNSSFTRGSKNSTNLSTSISSSRNTSSWSTESEVFTMDTFTSPPSTNYSTFKRNITVDYDASNFTNNTSLPFWNVIASSAVPEGLPKLNSSGTNLTNYTRKDYVTTSSNRTRSTLSRNSSSSSSSSEDSIAISPTNDSTYARNKTFIDYIRNLSNESYSTSVHNYSASSSTSSGTLPTDFFNVANRSNLTIVKEVSRSNSSKVREAAVAGITIWGIDYDQLLPLPLSTEALKNCIRDASVLEFGIMPVQIEFSKGSIVAMVTIAPPRGISAADLVMTIASSRTFTGTLVAEMSKVPVIVAIATGTVSAAVTSATTVDRSERSLEMTFTLPTLPQNSTTTDRVLDNYEARSTTLPPSVSTTWSSAASSSPISNTFEMVPNASSLGASSTSAAVVVTSTSIMPPGASSSAVSGTLEANTYLSSSSTSATSSQVLESSSTALGIWEARTSTMPATASTMSTSTQPAGASTMWPNVSSSSSTASSTLEASTSRLSPSASTTRALATVSSPPTTPNALKPTILPLTPNASGVGKSTTVASSLVTSTSNLPPVDDSATTSGSFGANTDTHLLPPRTSVTSTSPVTMPRVSTTMSSSFGANTNPNILPPGASATSTSSGPLPHVSTTISGSFGANTNPFILPPGASATSTSSVTLPHVSTTISGSFGTNTNPYILPPGASATSTSSVSMPRVSTTISGSFGANTDTYLVPPRTSVTSTSSVTLPHVSTTISGSFAANTNPYILPPGASATSTSSVSMPHVSTTIAGSFGASTDTHLLPPRTSVTSTSPVTMPHVSTTISGSFGANTNPYIFPPGPSATSTSSVSMPHVSTTISGSVGANTDTYTLPRGASATSTSSVTMPHVSTTISGSFGANTTPYTLPPAASETSSSSVTLPHVSTTFSGSFGANTDTYTLPLVSSATSTSSVSLPHVSTTISGSFGASTVTQTLLPTGASPTSASSVSMPHVSTTISGSFGTNTDTYTLPSGTSSTTLSVVLPSSSFSHNFAVSTPILPPASSVTMPHVSTTFSASLEPARISSTTYGNNFTADTANHANMSHAAASSNATAPGSFTQVRKPAFAATLMPHAGGHPQNGRVEGMSLGAPVAQPHFPILRAVLDQVAKRFAMETSKLPADSAPLRIRALDAPELPSFNVKPPTRNQNSFPSLLPASAAPSLLQSAAAPLPGFAQASNKVNAARSLAIQAKTSAKELHQCMLEQRDRAGVISFLSVGQVPFLATCPAGEGVLLTLGDKASKNIILRATLRESEAEIRNCSELDEAYIGEFWLTCKFGHLQPGPAHCIHSSTDEVLELGNKPCATSSSIRVNINGTQKVISIGEELQSQEQLAVNCSDVNPEYSGLIMLACYNGFITPNISGCVPTSRSAADLACESQKRHLEIVYRTALVELTRLTGEYESLVNSTACEDAEEQSYKEKEKSYWTTIDKQTVDIKTLTDTIHTYRKPLHELDKSTKRLTKYMKKLEKKCTDTDTFVDSLDKVKDAIDQMGTCPGLNPYDFHIPVWSGTYVFATFDLRVMDDEHVDTMMNSLCDSANKSEEAPDGKRWRSAETSEIEAQTIQYMPSTNTAKVPLMATCPNCEGEADSEDSEQHASGHARICWDVGAPLTEKGRRTTCSHGRKAVMCVIDNTPQLSDTE